MFTYSSVTVRCRRACYNWVCGDPKGAEVNITEDEREVLRLKMTSLHQKREWTMLLNSVAALLIIAITFLFGIFA